MSIPYVETYKIRDSICGIEDYRKGKKSDHFFPNEPHERFKPWYGGGGLHDCATIEEARQAIVDYATARLQEDIEALAARVCEYTKLKEQGIAGFATSER